MESNRRIATGLFWAAVVLFIVALAYAPVIGNHTRIGDFRWHTQAAYDLKDRGDLTISYFLFQLQVIGVSLLFPQQTPMESSVTATVISFMFLAVVVYGIFLRKTVPFPAAVLALALLLAAPVALFSIDDKNLYFGYISTTVFHNPTNAVVKPWALLLSLMILWVCQRRVHLWQVGALALVSIIVLMAKPSYTTALLPGLGLVTLYRLYRRQPISWMALILGIGIPSVLILVWQYWFEFTNVVGENAIALRPLAGMEIFTPIITMPFKLVASLAFPLAVLAGYTRAVRRDLYVTMSWVIFGVAAMYLYLFVETERMHAGNFYWGAQIGMFNLFTANWLLLLRQERTRRFWLVVFVFSLHVVSGIIWYAASMSPSWSDWW